MSTKQTNDALNEGINVADHIALRKVLNPFKWLEALYAVAYYIYEIAIGVAWLAYAAVLILFNFDAFLTVVSAASVLAFCYYTYRYLEPYLNKWTKSLLAGVLAVAGIFLIPLAIYTIIMFIKFPFALVTVGYNLASLGYWAGIGILSLFGLHIGSYVLECFTSPMSSVIRPVITFVREYPWISLGIATVGLSITSFLLFAALVTSGLVTLPLALISLQGVLNFIAPLFTTILAPLTAQFGATTAGVLVSILSVIALPVVVRTVCAVGRELIDLVELFVELYKEKVSEEEGAKSVFLGSKAAPGTEHGVRMATEDVNSPLYHGGNNNIFQQFLRNADKDSEVVTPEDRGTTYFDKFWWGLKCTFDQGPTDPEVNTYQYSGGFSTSFGK